MICGDYSGDIATYKVFLRLLGDKQYFVSIRDYKISEMPIALAIIFTRKSEVMEVMFDFVFENDDFKSLTSAMFSVYNKIADKKNIPHKKCIFYSRNYVSDKIHAELKIKDKYDYHDKIWIFSLLTEYKEILRQLNYVDVVDKAKKNFGKNQ